MSLRLGKKERGKEKQKASGSVHGIRSNQNGGHVAFFKAVNPQLFKGVIPYLRCGSGAAVVRQRKRRRHGEGM